MYNFDPETVRTYHLLSVEHKHYFFYSGIAKWFGRCRTSSSCRHATAKWGWKSVTTMYTVRKHTRLQKILQY